MQANFKDTTKSKPQIISLLLIAASIIIGFFFTIDQGYSHIEKKDTLEATKQELAEKKRALQKLQDTAKAIESDTVLQSDIERYAGAFREDTIFDSLFATINGINIASISISKGEKSPNGLSLASISLSLKAQDSNALNNFLNYLTNSKTGKKSYIIKSLTFPLDTTKNDPISVNIELGMYFFE